MPRGVVWLAGLALVALGCGGGAGGTGGGGAGGTAGGTGGAAGTVGAAGTGAGGALCAMDFTPCGGDLVGTWGSEPGCTAQQPAQSGGCAGQSFDFTKVVSQATWTFRADLTLTLSLSAAGPVTITAPDACLVSAAGAPIACTDAGASYAGRIAFPGGKPGAGTCQEANGTCTCTVPIVAAPQTASGTYSTSGTTVTPSIGTAGAPLDYCASSTTLKMKNHDATSAPGSAVYDKQ